MSLDILDASDAGGPAPAGRLVVDVFVDVTADDAFVSAGIFGYVQNGATLVYDSNEQFLPPGPENRFVSFGSAAYDRNGVARFDPAGTISEQAIQVAGPRYSSGGVPRFYATEIDATYFVVPPGPGGVPEEVAGRDGYVMRIALDISDVEIPGGDDANNYRLFTPGSEPTGYLPVFISDLPSGPDTGMRVYTYRSNSDGADWGVYVPEPTTAFLLIVLVCAARPQRGASG